mmetsp:Transcript_26349/g.61845  ORF Transcript_26349/g.61845 Transcript_26349/m.61845 type:complete len:222 (+) Transcript_26349:706-1371(+)
MLTEPRATLDREGNVGQRHVIHAHTHIRADKGGRIIRHDKPALRGLRQVAERSFGELHELRVVNRTRAGHDHARGCVVRFDVRFEVVAGERADVLLWPQNGARKPAALVRRLMEAVEDDLLVALLHLLHLTEDHAALTVDGCGFKQRVLQNVAEDVHSLTHVLLEHLGVVHGHLAARISIEVATNVLDLDLECLLRALGGALEGHVLEKVGCTIVFLRLVS